MQRGVKRLQVSSALRATLVVVICLAVTAVGSTAGVQLETVAGSPPGNLSSSGFVDGDGSNARFAFPVDVVVDTLTNTVYIADFNNCAIRAMDTATSRVTTIAGSTPASGVACGYVDHAVGTLARFRGPTGLAMNDKFVYISENGNHAIRILAVGRTNTVTTLAGGPTSGYVDGVGSIARFTAPAGLAFHSASNCLLIADTFNHVIRKIDLWSKRVSTIAGYNTDPPSTSLYGYINGVGSAARFYYPYGVAVSPNANLAFVTDQYNQVVRAIDLDLNAVLTVAGSVTSAALAGYTNGAAASARFHNPHGIAYDLHHKSALVVVDYGNDVVRLVSMDANHVSTLLGTTPPATAAGYADGSETTARVLEPTGIAPFRQGHQRGYWIADSGNHAIRRIVLPPFTASASSSNLVSRSASFLQTPPSVSPSHSQTCEPPLIEWFTFRYRAVNLTTDYFTVALQPSAPPFVAVGDATPTVWTSASLPLATLQRRSPFALNVSSSSLLDSRDASLRTASVVLGGGTLPLVASELVPLHDDPTPSRFRLLKLSLPSSNANWVSYPIKSSAAVTIVLVFSGCDNATTTTATVVVGLTQPPLVGQIPIVSSVVGSTTAVVSVTTATTAARVGAVRTLLLCTTTGASTGGLLGLTIARPDADGDDEVLPYARGAVVGNLIAVCVVGAVLCIVCCVYSVRCGTGLRASALRLALPSSLLPVLVAVLPSTIGAVVYLGHSSRSNNGSGGRGDVVTLAVFGALLCAVPLGMLAWVAFVLPSHLGLAVKPVKLEVASASTSSSSTGALVSALRWLHRSLSAETWVWGPKDDRSSVPSGEDKMRSLVAAERAGRVALLEYRLLWFGALDVTLVAFIAGLGVGSSFGGSTTCRASLIVVVVLLALETVLCVALKPFTTLRSQVTVALTLTCTTVSAVLQLAAATTNFEKALLASAALDLAVLGMAVTRLLLFDAPEVVLAARMVLVEMHVGHRRPSPLRGGEDNGSELVLHLDGRTSSVEFPDVQSVALTNAGAPAHALNATDDLAHAKARASLSFDSDQSSVDEDLQSKFWARDGNAKTMALPLDETDDWVPHNDLLSVYGVVASRERPSCE